MKNAIKRVPILGFIAKIIYGILYKQKPFPGSDAYWKQRYDSGGNSGSGSYNNLAKFKAEVINGFVKSNSVATVIEYGCGDGNQLKLAQYPSYIGFDISPKAISLCKYLFQNDQTKKFKLLSEYQNEMAQLTLSLDVIYHLIENNIYYSYIERLFNSSEKFVIIYSSNEEREQQYHVRHRQFTKWIETNISGWKLMLHIPNRFPVNIGSEESSFAEFYIYVKS